MGGHSGGLIQCGVDLNTTALERSILRVALIRSPSLPGTFIFSRAGAGLLQMWASWGWCINFEPFRGGTREVGEVAHFVVEAHNIGVCGVSDL